MALTTRTALRAMLGLQIGLAAGLLGMDFARVAPQMSWPGPAAPALDQPVSPGDQTRRFAPRILFLRPGQPMPGVDTADMPSRLFFDETAPGLVRATGAIAEGDAARFDEWLAARGAANTPLPDRVELHSPGGSVAEALAIGRAIRAAGLDTAVTAGDLCLSACPYVLIGGVDRQVSRAQVGVHQHYFGETTVLPAFLAVEDIQRGQAEVVVYLDEMGADLRLMAPAMATPPEDIYILLPDELTDYRVATALTD
jgi:hypothetical protein